MFGKNLDNSACNEDRIAFGLHLVFEGSANRIVLQQMREGRGLGHIIYGDQFKIRMMKGGPKEHSAGSAKAVDSDFGWHLSDPSYELSKQCAFSVP